MTYNHLIKRKDDEFICCLCKSSFKWRYLVEYHIRSKHTQERPFTCKICSKGFTAANRLKRHISAMHESGRFVCQVNCLSRFCNIHLI